MALKVALIQMNSGADMSANIAALDTMLATAAGQGAQLVATPENTFLMEEPKAERKLYAQDDHPGVAAAAQMAKQNKIWLLIGSVAVVPDSSLRAQQSNPELDRHGAKAPRDDDKKTVNRSLLLNPKGDIVATYDKIHLFDVEVGDGQSYRESAKILPGDTAVVVKVDHESWVVSGEKEQALTTNHYSPSTTLGLSICYDLRFPYLYRQLAHAGANILCVPSAFTQLTGEAHWHVLLRARAIEHGCFVIAPAQTGTHPGNRKTYGHSLVVDPWGRVVADGGTEPGIIMAEIDLGEVENVRSRLPSLRHDRVIAAPNGVVRD